MTGRRDTRVGESVVDVVLLVNWSTRLAKMGAEGIYVWKNATASAPVGLSGERQLGFKVLWRSFNKTSVEYCRSTNSPVCTSIAK